MKKIAIAMMALLCAAFANAQVAGNWRTTDHAADELKGTEAYSTTSFVSEKVTFTVFSNDSAQFLIGCPGEVFQTNTYNTDNVKVTIGLYDSNMHLVSKLEHLMFRRLDDMSYIRGQVHHPSMNQKWLKCHYELYGWLTREKGYIRILARLHESEFDVTIPTIQQ